jgi:hypothetical protein
MTPRLRRSWIELMTAPATLAVPALWTFVGMARPTASSDAAIEAAAIGNYELVEPTPGIVERFSGEASALTCVAHARHVDHSDPGCTSHHCTDHLRTEWSCAARFGPVVITEHYDGSGGASEHSWTFRDWRCVETFNPGVHALRELRVRRSRDGQLYEFSCAATRCEYGFGGPSHADCERDHPLPPPLYVRAMVDATPSPRGSLSWQRGAVAFGVLAALTLGLLHRLRARCGELLSRAWRSASIDTSRVVRVDGVPIGAALGAPAGPAIVLVDSIEDAASAYRGGRHDALVDVAVGTLDDLRGRLEERLRRAHSWVLLGATLAAVASAIALAVR